jgi:hypothetical protein
LHAYDALNLGKELYNSDQAGARDQFGAVNKFAIPTIADGKVFVGAANNLAIFGLFGTGSPAPAFATALSGLVAERDTQRTAFPNRPLSATPEPGWDAAIQEPVSVPAPASTALGPCAARCQPPRKGPPPLDDDALL